MSVPQLINALPMVLVSTAWCRFGDATTQQLQCSTGTPDILIGSDLLWTLWDIGGPQFFTQDIGNGFTILNTLLGPIAARKRLVQTSIRNYRQPEVCMTTIHLKTPSSPPVASDLLHKVQNLFDNALIQDEPDEPDSSDPDQHPAMKFVMSTLLQDPSDGRYFVQVPIKDPPLHLPDMRPLALRKQMYFFQELKKRPEQEEQYFGYFDELLRDDVTEEVPLFNINNADRPICYISHFGVFKDSATTSARPVFTATEALKGFASLNSQLEPGPSLLRPLQELLLEMRCFPKLISGDIKRAFLQIGLQDNNKDLFRFLLPKNRHLQPHSANLVDMRFRRMPFGPTSSPFLLQAVIRQHLQQHDNAIAPEIVKYIYVDNIFLPFSTTADALLKYRDTKDIFKECAMTVREWWSNDPEVNDNLIELEGTAQPAKKLLGVPYDAVHDLIGVNPAAPPTLVNGWTKRKLLTFLGSTFDPLGLYSPVTTTLKLLFQDSIRDKLSLDERIADNHTSKLSNFLRTWNQETMFLPRLITDNPQAQHVLHVFSDASGRAASTCAYLQNKSSRETQLICASTRIAPAHGMTIPRLELVGIVMASKLAKKLHTTLPVPVTRVILWTDSSVALHWVLGKSAADKGTFVKNRVKTINANLMNLPSELRHVAGTDNPADLPSRGCNPKDLNKCGANG